MSKQTKDSATFERYVTAVATGDLHAKRTGDKWEVIARFDKATGGLHLLPGYSAKVIRRKDGSRLVIFGDDSST